MDLVFNTNRGKTIILPLGGIVDASVNWGDGNIIHYITPTKKKNETKRSYDLYIL